MCTIKHRAHHAYMLEGAEVLQKAYNETSKISTLESLDNGDNDAFFERSYFSACVNGQPHTHLWW